MELPETHPPPQDCSHSHPLPSLLPLGHPLVHNAAADLGSSLLWCAQQVRPMCAFALNWRGASGGVCAYDDLHDWLFSFVWPTSGTAACDVFFFGAVFFQLAANISSAGLALRLVFFVRGSFCGCGHRFLSREGNSFDSKLARAAWGTAAVGTLSIAVSKRAYSDPVTQGEKEGLKEMGVERGEGVKEPRPAPITPPHSSTSNQAWGGSRFAG